MFNIAVEELFWDAVWECFARQPLVVVEVGALKQRKIEITRLNRSAWVITMGHERCETNRLYVNEVNLSALTSLLGARCRLSLPLGYAESGCHRLPNLDALRVNG